MYSYGNTSSEVKSVIIAAETFGCLLQQKNGSR